MACDKCFKDWISCGNTEIFIKGILPGLSVDYTWYLKNKGAVYTAGFTTDNDGHFTIPVSELPDGLLNPYAGLFQLTVNLAGTTCTPDELWNDSAYCEPYDCIEFEVINGTGVKNTLGCDCP